MASIPNFPENVKNTFFRVLNANRLIKTHYLFQNIVARTNIFPHTIHKINQLKGTSEFINGYMRGGRIYRTRRRKLVTAPRLWIAARVITARATAIMAALTTAGIGNWTIGIGNGTAVAEVSVDEVIKKVGLQISLRNCCGRHFVSSGLIFNLLSCFLYWPGSITWLFFRGHLRAGLSYT